MKAAFALGLLAGCSSSSRRSDLSQRCAGVDGLLDSPEKRSTCSSPTGGIQFLENHILIPLLMKGGWIPPALTVLAQALLALVFGSRPYGRRADARDGDSHHADALHRATAGAGHGHIRPRPSGTSRGWTNGDVIALVARFPQLAHTLAHVDLRERDQWNAGMWWRVAAGEARRPQCSTGGNKVRALSAAGGRLPATPSHCRRHWLHTRWLSLNARRSAPNAVITWPQETNAVSRDVGTVESVARHGRECSFGLLIATLRRVRRRLGGFPLAVAYLAPLDT